MWLLIDSVADYGIFMLNLEGKIVSWNVGAERIKGYLPEEILGRHFSCFYPEEDRVADKPARELSIARRTGRYAEEGWRLRKDGSRFWASIVISLIRDQAGQFIGYSKVTRDLTERRRAESLALQHEQRFRMLVENVADYAILMLDTQGRVISWNKGAEGIKGYTADEVVGRHFSCFYPRADHLAGKPGHELAIAIVAGRFEEEGWRVRKDGSQFWANVVISPVHDDEGVHIGFAKVTRDLTERRLAKARLQATTALHDAVLACAPYAILTVDLTGLITDVNPAFERMLWYKASEVVGKEKGCMMLDPAEIESKSIDLSAEYGITVTQKFQTVTHRASLGISDEQEWSCIRRDGSRFPISMTVTCVRDVNDTITGYVSILQDITERKRREEYTTHVAHHDFLTGLPNRLLLYDRLEVAIAGARRSGEMIAVLMLDLDHFKRINDSLGHHVGDEVLKEVANRVKGTIRDSDTMARMGGDEFVIVLGRIGNPAESEFLARAIIERVREPVTVGSSELVISPSIGISIYPEHGDSVSALLKNADSALYMAKGAGRSDYAMFNTGMAQRAQLKLNLESALGRAMRNEEFKLHYQPQVCLKTGAIVGMEALLRWFDPVLGTVSPGQFIGVAEECGLIVQIGEWVLRTACRDAQAMQQRTGSPFRLAVNLSVRQFHHADLVSLIRSALNESGLEASCLELEITESVLMENTPSSIQRLEEVRALGVSIAIDDFGVGFSSLSYITQFKIDTVKIDRSFISKLPISVVNGAVAQSIISLATSLGIKVVAEGVETQGQIGYLRARNCDIAQGNFLGQAVPADHFSSQGWVFGEARSERVSSPEGLIGGDH